MLQALGFNNSAPTKEEEQMHDDWNAMEQEMVESDRADGIENTQPARGKSQVQDGKRRKRADTPNERKENGEHGNKVEERIPGVNRAAANPSQPVNLPYECRCVRGCPIYKCPTCIGAGVERLNGEYVQCSGCRGLETITWCQLAREIGNMSK